MKTKRIFWGLILLILAILLVITKLELFQLHFKFWTLVLTIAFIFTLIHGILHKRIFQSVFSLAFLAMIYANSLGIARLVPWTLLFVALLVSIGLSMITKPFDKNGKSNWEQKHKISSYEFGDSRQDIKIKEKMSSSVRYVKANNLARVNINVTVASLKVYFDNVDFEGDTATVFINGSLSEIKLILPLEWEVVVNLNSVLSEVDNSKQTNSIYHKKILIEGNLNLSELKIEYI